MDSKSENNKRSYIKGLLRIVLSATIFLIILLAGLIIAIQIPFIQSKLVNKSTEYLSKTLNFPIKIGSVQIDWFDQVVLKDLEVRDLSNAQMIYLKEAKVDFEILSIFKAKVSLDEITLSNGKVNLIKYKDASLNMDEFIQAIAKAAPKSNKNKKPKPFTIPYVRLDNMSFSFEDTRKPHINHFDHNHFTLDSINGDVFELTAVQDTFKINVENLTAFETKTFLKVHDLDTEFLLCSKKMELNKLNTKIGESFFKDYLSFNYTKISDMTDFNDKVRIISSLDHSQISIQDLAFFAPDLMPYHDKAIISGDFNGYVVDFGVKNLDFAFGERSFFRGNLKLKGLPDLHETLIEFAYNNLSVESNDLKQYSSREAFEVMKKVAFVKGKGKFTGFANDFVTNASWVTGLGKLETDINLKINDNAKPKSFYKGRLKTYAFNFGKLVSKPDIIGLLDMDGHIEGNGFSVSEANVKVNAKINRIGINNYDYRNIKTNAQLSEKLFNGAIDIQDSNLVLNAIGKVDLTGKKNVFDIKANLNKANLKPLNLEFSANETVVKTDLYLNFEGLSIDDIEGSASFVNTYLLYNGVKEVIVDSLIVSSSQEGKTRTVRIDSDIADAYASGNFRFSQLYQDLRQNIEEYKLNLDNNSSELATYYAAKKTGLPSEKYHMDFHVALDDINSILSIYFPQAYLSKGVYLTGDYTSGYTNILNLHTTIDTLYFQENELYGTELEFSTSKIADSINTLAMLYVSSESQKIKSFPITENFYFEGIWNNRNIDFHTKINEKGSRNNASLMGNLAFLKDRKKLSMYNSNLNVLNQTWNISDHNNITFAKEEIFFENFSIFNGIQAISIDGMISNDKNKESILKVDNFKLENLNSLLSTTKMKGTLNGTVLIRDLYKDIDLEGNLLINDLILNEFLVGDVKGFSEYNTSNRVLEVKVDVERHDKKIIDLSGYVKPADGQNHEEVNLTANLDNANLQLLNPILKGVMSFQSGTATGRLKLTGTLDELVLKGVGDVKEGKFKVDYLGTVYNFDDKIYLDENLIGFKNLLLKDVNGNNAVIDGGLYHDSFKNFIVDVKGVMKNFNVLNVTEKENNDFYGNANVTGDFEILGAFTDLKINANATSNKGTKIFIPLNSTASLEQQSFIKFKKFDQASDSLEKSKLDLSGIKLEFNLDLNPDAYAEIIFDKRSGDIIRGTGYGNIKLKIDTRGDFSMFGNYSLTEGFYNFTLAGLISKEFKIKPNSSISWTGDPYSGVLNIDAIYQQYASLLPIINDSAKAVRPENRRKYPIDVLLNLKGDLMSPEISLGVDITKFPPDLSTEVLAFESNLLVNEPELNNQVFSLLVLGMLSRQNSFTGVAANPGGNLSEFLSNQLSNWLSQVDENLEIDINLNSLNLDALNTFQLRMSYTMMDGRLRITREGNFQNVQSAQANSITNIAGEWTIEYLLSNDGNLRLKVYNRANQNILLTSAGNSGTNSAGFSLLHTQSFNTLKELFEIRKKKEEELPLLNNDSSDTYTPDGPVNYFQKNKKIGVN